MKIDQKGERPSFSELTPRQTIYLNAVTRELYNYESGVIDGTYLEADDVELRKKQFTATIEYSNSILRTLANNSILVPFDEQNTNEKDEIDYTEVLWKINLGFDQEWDDEADKLSFLAKPPNLNQELVEASETIWRELIYDDTIGNLKNLFNESFNKKLEVSADVRRVYWNLTYEYRPGQIYWLTWVGIKATEDNYSDNFTVDFLRKRVLQSVNELAAKARNGIVETKFYDRSWKRPMSRFYKYWLVQVLSIKKESFKKIPSKSLLLDWFDV